MMEMILLFGIMCSWSGMVKASFVPVGDWITKEASLYETKSTPSYPTSSFIPSSSSSSSFSRIWTPEINAKTMSMTASSIQGQQEKKGYSSTSQHALDQPHSHLYSGSHSLQLPIECQRTDSKPHYHYHSQPHLSPFCLAKLILDTCNTHHTQHYITLLDFEAGYSHVLNTYFYMRKQPLAPQDRASKAFLWKLLHIPGIPVHDVDMVEGMQVFVYKCKDIAPASWIHEMWYRPDVKVELQFFL